MAGKLSPMMQQYMDIKQNYENCILFFRLGDFYEMFFDDAKLVSRELELTLTGKSCGLEERAPMCGVPFHSADTYISRLIAKGYKVAICEQTEDPASAKGLVKREVQQIVTPGTVISTAMLKDDENNYIASVYVDAMDIGLVYCDISTGETSLTSIDGTGRVESLANELVKINAREVLINEAADSQGFSEIISQLTGACCNNLNDDYYIGSAPTDAIKRQFGVISIKGLGVEDDSAAMHALGALILYLFETQKNDLSHIVSLKTYTTGEYMSLDKATIKNLELTESIFDKTLNGSLLGVLDRTHTAMGSRKLKQWLKEPLNDCEEICSRLDAVEVLLDDVLMRNNIKEHLKRVYDFERLTGRIACGKANGKDMIALRNSCFVIPDIKSEIRGTSSRLLTQLKKSIHDLEDVHNLIDRCVVEDPPFTIKEGDLIKDGFSQELDKLKNSISHAREWIAGLEATERERTGIKNLKVGFNKVFGYYIEITKSYYDLIPQDYIRKQTLSNCERFITPQLKETERVVLNAETEINRMEYDIFIDLRRRLQGYIAEIQETSRSIAVLDVLTSFAHVSEKNDYVKPEINAGDEIIIQEGRHPVIEQTIRDGIFVGNDTFINKSDRSMLLVTGPNMAGKSTYMRQTALIVLMAQTGCFVPCEMARIGVCDRVFTRIGASDNLARGQSTFYVEMSELAYILNTATDKSLVILDEIGRGTSTYDGLSIAWATAEYLCRPDRKVRTLFATHYHEMTELEDILAGVKNLNVNVAEENGEIVFLHKIIEGSASRSYGIHVARLAGVPSVLLKKADERLRLLEKGSKGCNPVYDNNEDDRAQLSFFDLAPDPVVTRLKEVDLMNITPSQALKILEELKEYL